jgi:prolyl 4-hydroxylase
MESLMQLAAMDPNNIKKVDANGWVSSSSLLLRENCIFLLNMHFISTLQTPLHEAVRGGYVQITAYLLSKGLDINERTHGGNGGSPLWWAKKTHGDNHAIVKYLINNGANEIAPG